MKNFSPVVKPISWAVVGCLVGAAVSAVLISGLSGTSGANICFYIGMAVLIIGLFSCLKGNPRNNVVGLIDKGFFSAHVVVDEEKTTKAMEKHYRENHVLDVHASSFCLIFTGIVMAVIAYIA